MKGKNKKKKKKGVSVGLFFVIVVFILIPIWAFPNDIKPINELDLFTRALLLYMMFSVGTSCYDSLCTCCTTTAFDIYVKRQYENREISYNAIFFSLV